jgi:hypothetical protein
MTSTTTTTRNPTDHDADFILLALPLSRCSVAAGGGMTRRTTLLCVLQTAIAQAQQFGADPLPEAVRAAQALKAGLEAFDEESRAERVARKIDELIVIQKRIAHGTHPAVPPD